ncbi:Duplicated homeodomain-like superfamily protein, putative [Theobroma cacao]|uniref:Duplicated homeodomain-like superfamily protein, putative n=1 Tax=Theobroma cacao TaxID=3641 RepID=A0A061FJ93_THECC|nr:Duplicated homeodomain-like superfamily protein, putative [Theobroma cacao]
MAESSADASAAPGIHEGSEIGMVGSNSGEEDKGRVDEGDRSFGGNRWPRQESLALLKIRSDMDAVFRDSSLKGPLWEEVSRKLAELGYHRSAKKCKEKFENVFKYHKRTKDGRTGKADGKTYRFFDQLEALENLHSLQSQSPPKPQTPTPTSAAMPWTNPPTASNIHVPSTTINPTNVPQTNATPSINPTISTQAVPIHSIGPYSNSIPSSFHNISSNLFSTSTSSSTASDDDSDQGSSKKKRKWKEFFWRLTKEVIEKQEELQNKFLRTIEKCEQERTAREEAWRIQEMARINREHEILVQERSTAAAKDAAVIAFLQKILGQQPNTVQVQPQENPQPTPPPPTAPLSLPPPLHQPQPQPPTPALNFDTSKMTNGAYNVVLSSPSRWPKAEVQALIRLRTNLNVKYQENGPKAPLWEEISAGMRKLGYSRSAKRCKEKWENINKYFKKVKESSKKRSEDSKTCPYFHQLDAIYKEKISKNENSVGSSGYGVKPESKMVPLMVQPEQQWPPQQQEISQQAEAMMEEAERENVDQIQEDEEDIGESEGEEYERNAFELVANKTAPIGTAE